MRGLDFSSWQAVLSTVFGLGLVTLVMVGVRREQEFRTPSSLAWRRGFSARPPRREAFRFNRRTSRSRGLLFYRLLQHTVVTGPVTYHRMAAGTVATWK